MIRRQEASSVSRHPHRGVMVVLFLLALPTAALAQPPHTEVGHLTRDQGLLGTEVYCILQDSRGYLWFGTERGLKKYDGYSITAYMYERGNSSSIINARVQCLWEDREGTLWIGTWGSLEKFDRVSNTFTHFVPHPEILVHSWANTIYDLCEDKNGTLWVGGDGLKVFDRVTEKFMHFRHDSADPGSLLHNRVGAIYEDRGGTLWIGTGGGLDRFDEKTRKFVHYWVDPNIQSGRDPDSRGFHWIQMIYEDQRGILWLCTNRGPVAFDRKAGRFRPYYIHTAEPDSSASRSVSSMCEDGAGTILIGTWKGGLLRYDAQADTFISYRPDPLAEDTLWVSSLYKDRSGVVWVGTHGEGIHQLVSQDTRFIPRTHRPGDRTSLRNIDVRLIYEDHTGTILVGTAAGIDRLDTRTGVFRHGAAPEGTYSITGFLEDGAEAFWLGVESARLERVFRQPYRREPFDDRRVGLGRSASSLFRDRAGLVWMASDAGLCQLDPQSGEFTDLGIGWQRPSISARLIVEDSIDASPTGWALWLGTNDGLWRYDARVNAYVRFGHDPRDPNSLASNSVTTVFRDSRGTLWVGTDRGLDRMDPRAGGFKSYTVNGGLPDNLVLGILEDNYGRIWVSTSRAISKLDPRTHRLSTYTMDEVLPNIRFGAGCCLRSATGEMYFGGKGGLVVFHPDSIRDNPYVPPIAITGFRKFDAAVGLDSAISEKKSIDLSYKDNIFSLEFAALNFVKPEQNQYAYRLEGHDSGWTYCGNRQYARYMNVPVGSYMFRVRGSNNDGMWNEEGASLRILIHPPYWQTWWFRGIVLILLGVLAYGGYRYRLAKLLALERLRLRIAGDLHDDIGSRLGSITLANELVARHLPPDHPDRRRLTDAIALARETSSDLRDVVWIINPGQDRLGDLVLRMRETADRMLAGIPHRFSRDGMVDSASAPMEFKRQILLMLKEALHNIVRHARATDVAISVSVQGAFLQITVRDNGIGFDRSNSSNGNGLKNMERRAHAIGGNLSVQSTLGEGTTVELRVNIPRTGYRPRHPTGVY